MLKRAEKYGFFTLAAGIFMYLLLRAIQVPLVNDESETFLFFVQPGDFIPWIAKHSVANNHFLNSAFSWVFYKLFGLDEWVLRLASLLSFIVFAVYLFRMGNAFIQNHLLRWLLWLSLLGSHYFIEFFAYCRGYAMSGAFLLAGIFHLIRWANNSHRLSHRNLKWSSFFMAGALFANLNLLYSYLLWLLLIFFILWQKNGSLKPPRPVWFSFLPLLYSVSIAFRLKASEQLYIGTNDGLEASIKSLLGLMFHHQENTVIYAVYAVVAIIVLLFSGYILRKNPRFAFSGFFIFFILLFFNVLAAFSAYVLLDMKLPVSRTILHWYLLLILAFIFALDNASYKKRAFLAILALPLLILPWNFYELANLNTSTDPSWKREHIPDSFYDFVVQDSPNTGVPPTLAAGLNFYKHNWAMLHLQKQQKVNVCQSYVEKEFIADYQIVNLQESPVFKDLYEQKLFDPHSGISLVKRKLFLTRQPLIRKEAKTFSQKDPGFHPLITLEEIDTLQGKAIQLDLTLSISLEDDLFMGIIPVYFNDAEGNVVGYQQVNLDHHHLNWKKGEPVSLSIYFNSVPLEAVQMESYIWNFNNQKYSLHSAQTVIHKLN